MAQYKFLKRSSTRAYDVSLVEITFASPKNELDQEDTMTVFRGVKSVGPWAICWLTYKNGSFEWYPCPMLLTKDMEVWLNSLV